MRKYLAAAAIGASLLASQAAAYDGNLTNVSDRIGSVTASSDHMEGMNSNTWIFLTGVAVFIIIVAVVASDRPGAGPVSP